MKKYSAESSPTSSGDPSKSARGRLSGGHSSNRRSSTAVESLAVFGNLKPQFLQGLTRAQVEAVYAAAKCRKVTANSVLTNQDDPANYLFLLLSGRARYFFVTEKGQKVILLWILPGEIVGSAALLPSPTEYHVSAEAVRSGSMLVWERPAIRSLGARYPRLFENALYLTLRYLAAYRTAHSALTCDTAHERLAHVLVNLASGIGQNVGNGFELKIRNEELANEANITLFTASRLLNEWQRAGLLAKGRGKILLRSPELLLEHVT